MLLHALVRLFQVRTRSTDLPVEKSPQRASQKGNWQVGREPENQHTKSSAGQSSKQDGLASDAVAELAP